MCSSPVTFGGGSAIENLGLGLAASARNRSAASQRAYQPASTSCGSYAGGMGLLWLIKGVRDPPVIEETRGRRELASGRPREASARAPPGLRLRRAPGGAWSQEFYRLGLAVNPRLASVGRDLCHAAADPGRERRGRLADDAAEAGGDRSARDLRPVLADGAQTRLRDLVGADGHTRGAGARVGEEPGLSHEDW